uniref:FAR1 domain-containing protein n=1 Tax=Lactuca sativa TaxID=4236 RepID=A0A9R1W829_LACSA|nr:hypothetical protein LSAT_V11C300146210 [Lactuca sativa]
MSTKEYQQICSTYLIDKAIESSNDLTIGTSISTLNDGAKGKFSKLNLTFNLLKDLQLFEYWTGTSYINQDDLYIPHVATDLIPKKRQIVSSVNEGIEMYRNYAKAVGFGIRLGTTTSYGDHSLRKKQIWKSKKKKTIDTLTSKRLKKQERKSNSKVTGCMAMIGFDRNAATITITVYAFKEAHNHQLTEFNEESICSPHHRLSIFDQELIVKASTINIGATKAHKIRADYTNIVGPNDAQYVVDQLIIRIDNYQNFHFEYKLDDDVLNAMFWVDETGKENYSKFSDVISMDATYRTNRYNMIFVPFTAINNHEKTINKKPTMIMSDMDAALSSSIAKIEPDVVSNSDFKKRINQLVWNMNIEPSEFENKWDLMLHEFHLKDNKWLADMFNKRDKWIPSYFRDIQMCGLMKTTSRFESSNSFFNVFSSPTNLLVDFMFNFDTALLKQRHEQKRLDIASRDTSPQLLFPHENLKIEKHAVTTQSLFRYITPLPLTEYSIL